jgi:hypothetical protein
MKAVGEYPGSFRRFESTKKLFVAKNCLPDMSTLRPFVVEFPTNQRETGASSLYPFRGTRIFSDDVLLRNRKFRVGFVIVKKTVCSSV